MINWHPEQKLGKIGEANKRVGHILVMRTFSKLFLWILVLVAGAAFAGQTSDLYSASVPVASQSPTERTQVLPQALQAVLIKVSGNNNISSVPSIHNQLSKAATMLQAYRYEKQQKGNGYLLFVSFEPEQVDSLLQANHQAVWGNDRPRLLVWVGKQDAQQATLATNDTAPEILQTILAAAKVRGVPLSFPTFDLDDIAAVQFTDLDKNNATAIVAASQRYPHSGVITLVLSTPNDKVWQGRWQLDLSGNQEQLVTKGQSMEQVINAGINQLADELASHYASLHPNQMGNHYRLQVTGIKSVTDFARVSHYLKQLAPIQQVSIEQVMPSQIIFNVNANGGKQLLQQAIALDHVLQPDKQPTTTAQDQDILLIYRVSS